MADIHKIVYVCVSHAVFLCLMAVFQCFGVFWAIYRVVWGCLIRDVLYKLGQSCGTRQIFKFRASSTIFNSEIHCLHGLEELVSNEIPPLYANPRPSWIQPKLMIIHYKITIFTIQVLSIELTDQSNKL